MTSLLMLIAWLTPATAGAADSQYVCPATIEAAWQITSPPDGWESFAGSVAERHHLSGVTFTSGHPRDRAYLKPYDTSKPGANELGTTRYRFSATYPGGIWLVCGYRNTPAIIFKRLPDTPVDCTVIWRARPGPSVQSITCRSVFTPAGQSASPPARR
jgi:hypothetical protein